MSKIVGIGACVMDTLITVPNYPDEDTKLGALSSKQAGGGPVATGLVAAQKLGIDAEFLGFLSDDASGNFLVSDFKKYGVKTDNIEIKSGYRSFASTILLSEATASRTCVFDRGNVPPLELNESQKKAIINADILMVDGNDLLAAVEGAKIARENGTKVLYDCGGLYKDVEKLLALTDIMIPSEEFSLKHTGCATAEEAAKELYRRYSPEIIVITQGAKGGVIYDGKRLKTYPVFPVKVVDSNGSGDVFHGAFAAAVSYGFDYEKCCIFSSMVSSIKCTGVGARESVPSFDTVKNALKEKGYEL